MNNNDFSINDILKNASDRVKRRVDVNNTSKKDYKNWGDFPKDRDQKPFDMNKAADSVSKKLSQFSSTMSVKLAEAASGLNDKVNGIKETEKQDASVDLAEKSPYLQEERKIEDSTHTYDDTDFRINLDELKEEFEKNSSSYSSYSSSPVSDKVSDLMGYLRQASHQARESELYGKVSDTLKGYAQSVSEALDNGDLQMSETADHSDGGIVLLSMMKTHSPTVISGTQKERVVQELSDAARKSNIVVEQIPMVLKDDISLRRLVADIRAVQSTNRVIVLDIIDSPNAEQLKIFEKFLEDAKSGSFHLAILSDDEFSNSWFKINGANQLVFDS